jgi:hypothetical protein
MVRTNFEHLGHWLFMLCVGLSSFLYLINMSSSQHYSCFNKYQNVLIFLEREHFGLRWELRLIGSQPANNPEQVETVPEDLIDLVTTELQYYRSKFAQLSSTAAVRPKDVSPPLNYVSTEAIFRLTP